MNRIVASALALAVVLAACSTASPTATGTPGTGAPPAAPGTLAPGASVAVPTFHGDVELESVIPKDVGGMTLEVQSVTAEQFFTEGTAPEDIEEFNAFLGRLGRAITDVSIAFGSATSEDFEDNISITAIRVAGADTATLLREILAFSEADATDEVTGTATVGGKSVTTFGTPDAEAQDLDYFYGVGDVVFQVSGSSMALIEEAVSKLP
jgi:hypothetical protein